MLEYGSMRSWAMELYEKGLITEKDTGGIDLEWGDPDVIMGMLEKVANYNINVKGLSGLHSPIRGLTKMGIISL